MVSGPAGTRCPDCASLRGTHLYKVNPAHIAIQTLIGLAAGSLGSYIVEATGFFVFYIIFFGAGAYGAAVAELMLKAIGRKHGRIVETVGALSVFLGGVIPMAPEILVAHISLLSHIIQIVAVGIAAGACHARLKYF